MAAYMHVQSCEQGMRGYARRACARDDSPNCRQLKPRSSSAKRLPQCGNRDLPTACQLLCAVPWPSRDEKRWCRIG
eukprot:scaffold13253_cov140-Isochrysis_galbana.AAC.8